MRSKREIYKNEQEQILNEIYAIVCGEEPTFVLHELEHDNQKIKSILEMFPRIKKYYTLSNLPALSYPENSKRPYLSIAKIILRKKYNIASQDCRIKVDGKTIRTIRYMLTPRENLIPT